MLSISRKSFLALLLFCAGIKSKIRYFYFSDSETKTVAAFSEVVLPITEPGMPNLEEANVMRRLDEELYFVSEEIQEDFHSAVMVLEYLPIFYGHFSFFRIFHGKNGKSFYPFGQRQILISSVL